MACALGLTTMPHTHSDPSVGLTFGQRHSAVLPTLCPHLCAPQLSSDTGPLSHRICRLLKLVLRDTRPSINAHAHSRPSTLSWRSHRAPVLRDSGMLLRDDGMRWGLALPVPSRLLCCVQKRLRGRHGRAGGS